MGREVALQFTLVVNKKMAGRSPLSREGSREGFHCSRCRGGHSMGGSGKEVAENQVVGNGGENLEERWYNLENSVGERRSLFFLERELDASLRFE